MAFEEYAILDPIEHEFEKEPGKTWTIKPPTSKEEITLSRFYAEGRITFIDGQRFTYPWSNIEIAIRQLAMLFGGTNIPISEKNKNPVLKQDADIAEVEAYLGTLSTPVIKELWAALGKAVPGWGPAGTSKN